MNVDFELLERDGAARICRFKTPHGTVETPALLPVLNPTKLVITPEELRRSFGIEMVITNAYIIYRNPELRERARKEGVHRLLGFDGAVMTDSGTFQSHVYRTIEIKPEEIFDFQIEIGSDVATVLDVFSEPEFSRNEAENSVHLTLQRTKDVLSRMRGNSMIASTIQGSLYQDIREEAAASISTLVDYCAIGGVVPLMEQHRYRELISIIAATLRTVNRSRPLHLFGAGHPSILPLAVMLGCDLFDSASYVKYAYDGRMMLEWGSTDLEKLRYNSCTCPACISHTVDELRSLKGEERTIFLARHNLHVLLSTIKRIKQAIRDGELWNLVQNASRADPALFDAFLSAVNAGATNDFEPLSRKSGFNVMDSISLSIPPLRNALERAGSIRPGKANELLFLRARHPYFSRFDFSMKEDRDVACITPLGIIPLHLTESFPFAQSTIASTLRANINIMEYAERHGYTSFFISEYRESNAPPPQEEYLMQCRAVMHYQFGERAADAILSIPIFTVSSKNTHKLRSVFHNERQLLFFRTSDGLFSLKFEGGKVLHSALPFPKLRVICTSEAAPFVSSGRTLFSKFAVDADPALLPGDECLVVNEADELLAVGRTLLSGKEIMQFRKGVAVEVREGQASASSRQPEHMKENHQLS